ncbi:MAG: YihY/virulence factor BrkB family protein [Thiobacillus sp.]|nr:YihY/virulence factor BrkB family protein [Thiobacillus sp.]MDP2977741.1 YihY/virulence factor BrkB family protein [Thiobacillus sp.]
MKVEAIPVSPPEPRSTASKTALSGLVARLADAPIHWARRLKIVLTGSLTSWIDHRGASKGAALAFYTLFSMTPILVLAIAVAGYVFGAEAAQGEIVAQVQGLVGENGAQAIQALLAGARDPVSGMVATLVASVLLLVGATTVFAELKGSLDELWGVNKTSHSAFIVLLRTRLLSFGMVLVLAFLLLVSLVVSAVLAMLEDYAHGILGSSSAVLATTSSVISFGVIACMFAVIYKTLPDAPLSWRDVWIGAAFTAGLFSLGKYAIGLYLGTSGVASSFGAAGSLIALLLWVYYSAQIFFLGAEFTRQYALWFGSLQHERLRLDEMERRAVQQDTE